MSEQNKQQKPTKLLLLGAIIITVLGGGWLVYWQFPPWLTGQAEELPVTETVVEPKVNNFEDCVAATNLVYTAYPAKCIAPGGQVFTDPGLGPQVIKKVEIK